MSQLIKKFLADNAVADEKIRLDNDSYLRARDAGNAADVDILKLDASDEIVIADNVVKPATDNGVQLGAAGKHFSSIFVREMTGDGASINLLTGMKPDTDSALTLGTATRRFATLFTTQIDSQATDLELNTSGNILAGSNIVPQADGVSDLGSTVNRFFTAFLSGGISALDAAIPVVTDVGVTIKSDSTSAPGQIALAENNGTNSVGFKAPSTLGATTIWELPNGDGSANQVLKTSGAGVLSWATASGATNNKETFTLNGTNITNQYIDFAQVALTGSVHLIVKGGPATLEGASYDYSLSYTGGAGGKTRLTFLNDLATAGASALVSGDILQVVYEY